MFVLIKRVIPMVLPVLFILSLLSCDIPKIYTTEARIYEHPTNGLEYYYEVPNNKITVKSMFFFCNSLSFGGGGWRVPTITELRALAICPSIQVGGACAVSESCYIEYNCYDNDSCTCRDLDEIEEGVCYSIMVDSDWKCNSIVSSTLLSSPENLPDMRAYWAFYPNADGLFSVYAYEDWHDVFCVREKSNEEKSDSLNELADGE